MTIISTTIPVECNLIIETGQIIDNNTGTESADYMLDLSGLDTEDNFIDNLIDRLHELENGIFANNFLIKNVNLSDIEYQFSNDEKIQLAENFDNINFIY